MNSNENLNTEYKREFIDDIKNELLAFLNTSGGTIYVGLNDDRTVYEPFENIDRNQIDLKINNWMENAIYPSTFGLIRYGFNSDGILIINVIEGNNKPYYLKDKGPNPSSIYNNK